MKILHINRNYMDNPLHQLMVEELENVGYSNVVFSPRLHNEKAKVIPKPYVFACECIKGWHRFFFYYKQKKIFDAAEAAVSVDGFDLIHAYTLFTDGNCARNLSKKYGIPYVVAVRNTDVNTFFSKMPHLRQRGVDIMRDAQAVFFLSEAYRKVVFEKYIPQKYRDELYSKTRIIPNGIDYFWHENAFDGDRHTPEREVKLVYAGRIDKNKNIPTIQKAMDILSDKGYSAILTVVGKIEDAGEYKKIIKHKNTTYIPPVSKERLIEIYRSSDVFVMPSFTESFGLVYAEAMSQGLPVIYTKGQGFDEQFEDGSVGYRVDSHSASSVADGIVRVIVNYETISRRVPQLSSMFKWSEIIKEYTSVYDRIKQ